MFSTSPEYRYLRDVLGLEGFVRPEGHEYAPMALAQTSMEPMVAGDGEITVFADKDLSSSESELLKKMLGSIKIENFKTIVGDVQAASETAGAHIFISSTNTFPINTPASVQIKNFYAMASDEAHPSETMAYKKAAWADLQSFKKRIHG